MFVYLLQQEKQLRLSVAFPPHLNVNIIIESSAEKQKVHFIFHFSAHTKPRKDKKKK